VLDPLRLRLIVEIGHHRSISRAAEACSIGQPAASTHLRTLEAAMGQRLVERDGRASRLTDAGWVVAREGAQALATLARIERELDELAHGRRGVLRVAACASFADDALTEVIARFIPLCPDVRIEVGVGTSREVTDRVRRGETNLGLAGAVDLYDDVERVLLLSEEILAVTAPGLVPSSDSASIEQLATTPLILFPPGSSSRMVAERALFSVGVRPDRTIELQSQHGVKQAVKRRLGVGFMPLRTIAGELERGELTVLPIDGALTMRRALFVLHPVDRRLTPPESTFVEVLRVFGRSNA
jgi:DNA-binding transcriptional LysR family regulator